MKFATLFALTAFLSFSGLATAGTLDGARRLSAQIESMTGVQVISPTAKDEKYTAPQALQNLQVALEQVVSALELQAKMMPNDPVTPVRIGRLVARSLDVAANEQGDIKRLKFNKVRDQEALGRFCQLASPCCDLFTKQISEKICAAK